MSLRTAYLRAAAPLIPGASRLPGVPGHGKEIPTDLERSLPGVRADPHRVAEYARVCGFALRGPLPVTYPHVLAFPLHMALMTDGSFPVGPIGLVHVTNSVTQRRPIGLAEPLDLRVRPLAFEPHPKGRAFALLTEARVGDELVWEERSTFLARGGGSGDGEAPKGSRKAASPPEATAQWRLPGDLGRRYASVSGDSNPIHLHPLSARLFGFPSAIAHGMWTLARCLSALDARLPDAFTARADFKTPMLIPGTAAFGFEGERFTVRDPRSGAPHLDGRIA